MVKPLLGRALDSIDLGKEVFRMEMPIIIDENGDISFFGSRSGAESHLEAIDVIANEYVGYDCQGRLLSLKVLNEHLISIELAEDIPHHAEELRLKLINFLAVVGENSGADELEKLVAQCAPYIRS